MAASLELQSTDAYELAHAAVHANAPFSVFPGALPAGPRHGATLNKLSV
jgi:hypothetical protein